MTAIQYLRQQFAGIGEFTKEYMALSKPEREQLKQYAKEEMVALGIEPGTEAEPVPGA